MNDVIPTASSREIEAGAALPAHAHRPAVSGALSRLFALAEAYPDLKANQNMMQLTEELTGTENKISFARQSFNDAVMGYNTASQQFPTNVIASAFSFAPAELLKSTESDDERRPVKVQF